MDGFVSLDLLYNKIHPSIDAAFGADCLTPLKILKIVNSWSKKWILVMLSRIVTCCKNCHILICSPLKPYLTSGGGGGGHDGLLKCF